MPESDDSILQRNADGCVNLPLTSPSYSLQLSIPYPAVATSPEDALPENSQSIQSTVIQSETTATPSASNSPQQSLCSLASTDQANSQSNSSATSSSPPKQLPKFVENSEMVPSLSNEQPGEFLDILFSNDIMEDIHPEKN